MVQQNLVSYIISQLNKGRSLEEINDFLVRSGYDRQEVESSVQYVINTRSNPELAEEQRIVQLSDYIKQQESAGYDSRTIANFLTSRGYPYFEVDSALKRAEQKPASKFEHKLIITALVLMFIMTSVVSVLYFKAYSTIGVDVPEQLLDVEASKLTTVVKQGGDLSFQVKLINFGYEKRFDVLLRYQVLDRNTDTVILEKSETVALSTTLENIASFEIPESIKTGNYILRVDAIYQDYTATSGFIFEIVRKDIDEKEYERIVEEKKQEEIEDTIPEPDKIPEQEPTTEPTTQTPIVKPDTRFYDGLTRQQAFDIIRATSAREPERALEMCDEFTLSSLRASCITEIAKFKENAVICEELDSGDKDNCYVQIAIETRDDSVCDSITDSNVKQACALAVFSRTMNQNTDPEVLRQKLFGIQATPNLP